jgi:hypothetical protein
VKKRLKRLLFFVAIIGFFLSWMLGKYVATIGPDISKEEEGKAVAAADDTRVTLNTVIEKRYVYTFCGHQVRKEEQAPKEFVGMTLDGLKKALPDSHIISFSQEKIVIKEEIDQYCNKHYILKDSGGYVCLMINKQGTAELKVEKKFTIKVSALRKDEKEKLNAGMVFGTQKEAEDYAQKLSKSLHNQG